MKVSLIVAMDMERGIGRNNDLMWHLPDDMQFFKETTQDHIVVMGRKNYDSIPEKYRPLPRRENVVLTRNASFKAENCRVFNALEDCLQAYKDETDRTVFIIGGGEIYRLALEQNIVDEMYITHVNKTYGADTFFPDFDLRNWAVTTLMEHPKDDKHDASFSVVKYTKSTPNN
jgi:dihydrofolate reductase